MYFGDMFANSTQAIETILPEEKLETAIFAKNAEEELWQRIVTGIS